MKAWALYILSVASLMMLATTGKGVYSGATLFFLAITAFSRNI